MPEAAPYYELYLDEAVYRSAAEDLRDLRIQDSTGAPVPYYMESGAETVEEHSAVYTSELIHKAVKGTDTLLDYQIKPLAEDVDIQGNRLVFELPAESFLKHVEVWGGYDGQAWEQLGTGDLYATSGLSADSITLERSYKFGYYRLVVKNNPEGLEFPGLTLVDSSREWSTAAFMRQKTPQTEIKQVENRTEIMISNTDRLKIGKVMLGSTGNFCGAMSCMTVPGLRYRSPEAESCTGWTSRIPGSPGRRFSRWFRPLLIPCAWSSTIWTMPPSPSRILRSNIW